MLFDQRMLGQKFREPATQRAHAVTMNDPHRRLARQRRLINEFVHAVRRFFDGAANHINFVASRFIARLRVHCDAEPIAPHRPHADFAACASSAIASTSLSGMRIRSGPASISALRPS